MFLRAFKILFIVALFAIFVVQAQTQVFINSKELSDNLIIDNELYILAKSFADSTNSNFSYEANLGILALDFNGHILTADNSLIEIDGKNIQGRLVYPDDKLYLPLKSLAKAYNAASFTDTEASYFILPRASLISSTMNSYSDYDRVVLEFKGLSPYKSTYNSELNILELLFDNVLEQPFTVSYGSKMVMELGSSLGYLKLKLILSEANNYEIYNEASPNGYKVIIDTFSADSQKTNHKKIEIVLKQTQIEESKYFIEQLKQFLEANNIDVEIILEEDKIDYLADIFLTINVTEINRNSINIYYQSTNPSEYLIRENAANALRRSNKPERRLLLDKIASNYLFGQELANRISNTIFQNIGYQSQVFAENLSAIANYAGRGIVIESSKENLNNELLIDSLARTIISHLENYD